MNFETREKSMATKTLIELQAEYEQLEKKYKSERSALEKQIAQVRKSEQADAVEKIRAIMTEYGIKASELNAATKPQKAQKRGTVEAKFRGPNGQTWTGRGRQPRWIGEDREKFRI